MDDQGNGGSRPMVQGNWTCSGCGATITELPFEPDGERPVFCRECHQKKQAERRGPREMVQGDWECAECGVKITQLPFQPDGSQPILCKACYLKQKDAR